MGEPGLQIDEDSPNEDSSYTSRKDRKEEAEGSECGPKSYYDDSIADQERDTARSGIPFGYLLLLCLITGRVSLDIPKFSGRGGVMIGSSRAANAKHQPRPKAVG